MMRDMRLSVPEQRFAEPEPTFVGARCSGPRRLLGGQDLGAQQLERITLQIVLSGEVPVKGRPADVGRIADLGHSDLVIHSPGQQVRKRRPQRGTGSGRSAIDPMRIGHAMFPVDLHGVARRRTAGALCSGTLMPPLAFPR